MIPGIPLCGLWAVAGEWCLPQVPGFQLEAHAYLMDRAGSLLAHLLFEFWENYQMKHACCRLIYRIPRPFMAVMAFYVAVTLLSPTTC